MTDHLSDERLREDLQSIVEDAMNSAIPEPWEVSANAVARIIALLRRREAEREQGGGVEAIAVCRAVVEADSTPNGGTNTVGLLLNLRNIAVLARRALAATSQDPTRADRSGQGREG